MNPTSNKKGYYRNMCQHLERIKWEKHIEEVLQREAEMVVLVEWVVWSTTEELMSACWGSLKRWATGLGIAGRSWKTSWWSWCCGRGSPAAATVTHNQTEKILMRHNFGSTRAKWNNKLKNWLIKVNLFGWGGQSLANLSTSCLTSDSAPVKMEPSQTSQ
jgi:hypothetical protein